MFVYRLDENVAGFSEEGEFVEPEDQDQGHFAEQGKLLSELAPKLICIYFDQMIYSENQWFTKPFQKVYGNYFATLCSSYMQP